MIMIKSNHCCPSERLRCYYFSDKGNAEQFASKRGPGRKIITAHDDPKKVKNPQYRVYVSWSIN